MPAAHNHLWTTPQGTSIPRILNVMGKAPSIDDMPDAVRDDILAHRILVAAAGGAARDSAQSHYGIHRDVMAA
ncbi:MAG: hypothetical protein QG597_860 [Actinomycetota bacterium]|nr:hypothetical protein [Actinomycetota bacterium]